MLSIELRGVTKVRATLDRMDVAGYLADSVEDVVMELVNYGASLTPVRTGSMRAAWAGESFGLTGRVFIDPAAVNSRTGVPVDDYAGIISDRYGIMADLEMLSEILGGEVLEVIQW